MKIRTYTPEETDELIRKFSIITEYWYSINEKVCTLILDAYEQYKTTFKKSLFKWKPYNFDEFIKQLTSSNSVYLQEYKANASDDCLLLRTLLYKDCTYFRGVGYFTNVYDYIFTRYGNTPFTLEEKALLREASDVTDDIYLDYALRYKYKVLMKYASRPFEFDESDIEWLETVERYYERAIKWNSV